MQNEIHAISITESVALFPILLYNYSIEFDITFSKGDILCLLKNATKKF